MDRWIASAALAVLLAGAAAPAAAEGPFELRDDLGRVVGGVEACFWFGPERRCSELGPGEAVRWPVGATALRAEGSAHGPVWPCASPRAPAGRRWSG